MSCLMVDESMGDAFIDATMPSFFTSVYLLANALYNISFFAVLCPASAVLLIFLYYRLIYRPAIKSHEERKTLLKLRKWNSDFGREEKLFRQSTRHPREVAYGVGEFFRRLLVSLYYGMVTLITHVSDKRLKEHVVVESAHSKRWCAMNKPALHQGTVLSNSVRDNISLISFDGGSNAGVDDNANNGHYPVRKLRIFRNPPEIARMMRASWWTAHDSQSISISDSLVHEPSIIFRSDDSLIRASQRVLRATIIFDTGEALLRIWSNLLITAVHGNGVDNDWKVELFEVPTSALLKELQNIFDGFYPDGIPMSKVEKREACELFRKWVEGQKSLRTSDGMCSNSQMVLFKEFHDWFYDLSEKIHDLASDRLLTHLLRLTRRSDAASADAVKLLNTVAPKHSNTIYKPYLPTPQSPIGASSLATPSITRHLHNCSGKDTIPDIQEQTDDEDL